MDWMRMDLDEKKKSVKLKKNDDELFIATRILTLHLRHILILELERCKL